jgi:putative transposase
LIPAPGLGRLVPFAELLGRFGRAGETAESPVVAIEPLLPFCARTNEPEKIKDEDQSMKCSRFTEEQIIGILKEHEAGVSVADLCRKHGVSDASIYKWKARFGGMDVSEAKRLRTVVDENTKLKRLLADAMLDNAALKDLLGKKW